MELQDALDRLGKARRRGEPCRLASAIVLEDGKPPSRVRMFAQGVNETDYGPLTFDDLAAAIVMMNYERKGNPLFIDWNHGMQPTVDEDGDVEHRPTREEGASAGTFDLQVLEGELWAVNIRWTPDGAADVGGHRYNLTSPACTTWVDEYGVKRPEFFINFALVNIAGMNNQKALAAAGRPEGTTTMDETTTLREQNAKLITEKLTLEGAAKTSALLLSGALGMSPTSTEEQRLAAASELVGFRTKLLATTGAQDFAGALGTVLAWQRSHAEVLELRARTEQGAIAKRREDYEALVQKAHDEGKWPKGQRKFWDEQVVKDGAVTEQGLALFSGFVATAQPQVQLAARPGGPAPAAAPRQPPATGTAPTQDEVDMDRVMKVDGPKFREWELAQQTGARH